MWWGRRYDLLWISGSVLWWNGHLNTPAGTLQSYVVVFFLCPSALQMCSFIWKFTHITSHYTHSMGVFKLKVLMLNSNFYSDLVFLFFMYFYQTVRCSLMMIDKMCKKYGFWFDHYVRQWMWIRFRTTYVLFWSHVYEKKQNRSELPQYVMWTCFLLNKCTTS